MAKYQMIQATNQNVGAVAVGGLMPMGNITRKISCGGGCEPTFQLASTGDNTVVISECGYYRVLYSASLEAGAAGVVELTLLVNDVAVYTAQVTATEGGTVNLTIPYVVRAFANCNSLPNNLPMRLQVRLGTTAVTAGTANILVEKVY